VLTDSGDGQPLNPSLNPDLFAATAPPPSDDPCLKRRSIHMTAMLRGALHRSEYSPDSLAVFRGSRLL
jgi:hypothetical protein